MKKLIFIFMMVLTSNFYGQNADWAGTKKFKPTLKFVGLPVNNANTKFMTLDANGKPCTSDVPVSEPQVQSDWNATSGLGMILNKPSFSALTLSQVLNAGNSATGLSINLQSRSNYTTVGSGMITIGAGESSSQYYSSGIGTGTGVIMFPLLINSGKYIVTSIQNNPAGGDGNVPRPNYGLPVYADNAAAVSAGLINGSTYRTSTGVLMVVY